MLIHAPGPVYHPSFPLSVAPTVISCHFISSYHHCFLIPFLVLLGEGHPNSHPLPNSLVTSHGKSTRKQNIGSFNQSVETVLDCKSVCWKKKEKSLQIYVIMLSEQEFENRDPKKKLCYIILCYAVCPYPIFTVALYSLCTQKSKRLSFLIYLEK